MSKVTKNAPRRIKLLQPTLPNGRPNPEFYYYYGQQIEKNKQTKIKHESLAKAEWQEKKERENYYQNKK